MEYAEKMGRSVLVVDDDHDFADALKDMLEGHGYVVQVENSFASAQKAVDKFDARVALLDIKLGRSNGVDLIPALQEKRPEINCMMVTGYAAINTAVQALRSGAYDYLSKPLNPDTLLDTLERCFTAMDMEEAIRRERRTQQAILDNSTAVIHLKDAEGRYQMVNRHFEDVYGLLRESIIGKSDEEVFGGARWQAFSEHDSEVLAKGVGQQIEENLPARESVRTYITNRFPLLDDNNQANGVCAISTDITERKQAEDQLAANEKLMRSLYNETPSMFFTVDQKGVLTAINQFAASVLDYPKKELIGNPLQDLVLESDREALRDSIASCFSAPGVSQHIELRYLRRNDGEIWVRQVARAVSDLGGEPATLIVCEDITEARELSQQLTHQASHDELTGLVNRREFEIRLNRAAQSVRDGETEGVLCYLDLDQFKIINDTCGHVAGDELLRELGHLLGQKVRKHDTLARLGGDEFGILLENCPLPEAMRVAENLRHSVEEFRFFWEGRSFQIGVSIGVVAIDAQVSGVNALMSAADSACYAAKDQGRNRIHLYEEADEELAKRKGEMQWVGRIQQALDEDRFELAYQPFYRLTDDSTEKECRFEILVRLRDTDGTLIQPNSFLPAAERYDLATRIDKWVLTNAMKYFREHPEHAARVKLCAINLSGQSIGNVDFVDFAIEQIVNGPLPCEHICLEITETAAISNLKSVNEFLSKIRQLGVRVALDDFGSGFSSFLYLKSLEVDFIKIDGMFVKDIAHDSMDLAMVKSINEVVQMLGKQTIAEFVENDAILDEVRKLGVDYGQGFGMARPQPLNELFNE